MRRITTGFAAGLAVVVAAVVGCGPGKELPVRPTAPAGVTAAESPAPALPTKSDPAAAAIADRYVKAVTGGHPERAARGKVCRTTATGLWNVNGNWINATQEFQTVWPDRVRCTYTFPDGQIPTHVFGLRRPTGWMLAGGQADTALDPRQHEDRILVDTLSRHWLPLLLPLTAPGAVVFAPGKDRLDNREVDTVKLAVPDCPVMTLLFDPGTGLLRQVDYVHVEGGVTRVSKSAAFGDHQAAGGLVLPHRVEFFQNGVGALRWTMTAWEFPEKLDDGLFDAPK